MTPCGASLRASDSSLRAADPLDRHALVVGEFDDVVDRRRCPSSSAETQISRTLRRPGDRAARGPPDGLRPVRRRDPWPPARLGASARPFAHHDPVRRRPRCARRTTTRPAGRSLAPAGGRGASAGGAAAPTGRAGAGGRPLAPPRPGCARLLPAACPLRAAATRSCVPRLVHVVDHGDRPAGDPLRRPSAPRPSARRPFTVTGAPTALDRRRCISSRNGASFGSSHTTEQSTLPIIQPAPRTSADDVRAAAAASRRPSSARSVSGKCWPMSPRPAAPSSASATAWATASASL